MRAHRAPDDELEPELSEPESDLRSLPAPLTRQELGRFHPSARESKAQPLPRTVGPAGPGCRKRTGPAGWRASPSGHASQAEPLGRQRLAASTA